MPNSTQPIANQRKCRRAPGQQPPAGCAAQELKSRLRDDRPDERLEPPVTRDQRGADEGDQKADQTKPAGGVRLAREQADQSQLQHDHRDKPQHAVERVRQVARRLTCREQAEHLMHDDQRAGRRTDRTSQATKGLRVMARSASR